MDLTYLEKLVKLFDESTLTELEIDEEGAQVRLARQQEAPPTFQYGGFGPPAFGPAQYNGGAPPTGQAAPEAPKAAAPPEKKLHEMKSPIVGTFYRSPAPDADAYVQIGQSVQAGTTLCIIEAMKLMNEIECDVAGKIVKILVEDGKPVEYGQTLMLIDEG